MKLITRRRIRELTGHANIGPIVERGRLCLSGPTDWLEAVRSEAYPVSDLDALSVRSTEPWSISMLPIEPKISIGKTETGWSACWTFLGLGTAIQFSPDVTFAEIAEPIRRAYRETIGAEVSA